MAHLEDTEITSTVWTPGRIELLETLRNAPVDVDIKSHFVPVCFATTGVRQQKRQIVSSMYCTTVQ